MYEFSSGFMEQNVQVASEKGEFYLATSSLALCEKRKRKR